MSNATQIDNDGLDAVALSFNLGLQLFHFVAVEGIRDILNVDFSSVNTNLQE